MKLNNQTKKVFFNYKNYFIVQNNIGDIEVINDLGDSF